MIQKESVKKARLHSEENEFYQDFKMRVSIYLSIVKIPFDFPFLLGLINLQRKS